MPKGTTKTRFDNIAKEGATVTIEEVNYDDCVRMAAAEAAKTEHGIIVQDTAWDGYDFCTVKKFHPGSCRDTEHWFLRLTSS